MKYFYKALLAIILLPLFSSAQSNYKPGYVVTLKGDTIKGFINYMEWDNNPKAISFKKEFQQINPEIITNKTANAFALTGQLYYEKFIVNVSLDPVNISSLASVLDTTSHKDTVFLKVLNKGKYITLLGYKDDIKSRFYLSERGQRQPYELVYHTYYDHDELSTKNVRRYRTQLQNIIQKYNIENDRLSREINQSDYTETDLKHISQNINGNSSSQFNTPNLFGTRLFAGAGINYNNFKFTGNFQFASFPASNSISPKIDAGIDFFINKNVQRFYLRAEVSFTYGQYGFTGANSANISGTTTLNFKQYSAAISPQIIYNVYNGQQCKFYMDIGAAINLAAYNKYKVVTTYDSFPSQTQYNYPQFERDFITLPIKAGVTINKKFEIYGCYIPVTSINGFTGNAFESNITSYQLGLNYFFVGNHQ